MGTTYLEAGEVQSICPASLLNDGTQSVMVENGSRSWSQDTHTIRTVRRFL